MVNGQRVGLGGTLDALKAVSGHDFQAFLLPLRMLELFGIGHNSNRNPVTHRARNSRRNNATLHDADGGNWLNMVSLVVPALAS
jgi:hypothetical protein